MDDSTKAPAERSAADAEPVGIDVDSGPLVLTDEIARRMRSATGLDPESAELPHTIAAPLTAPVQDALIGDPRLAIDLSRTMHTEQRIESARALEVGATYTATATVESVRAAAGGRLIAFVTIVRDEAGEVVQTLRTTLMSAPAEGSGAA